MPTRPTSTGIGLPGRPSRSQRPLPRRLVTLRVAEISRTLQRTAAKCPARELAADSSSHLAVSQREPDDLAEGDTKGLTDIFLHDLRIGETSRLTFRRSGRTAHPTLDAAAEELVYDQRKADRQRQVLFGGLWEDTVAESVSLIDDSAGLPLDNHHRVISADVNMWPISTPGPMMTSRPGKRMSTTARSLGIGAARARPIVANTGSAPSFPSAYGAEVRWYLPRAELLVKVSSALVGGRVAPLPRHCLPWA